MSTTAGVFSETTLQNQRVRADRLLLDDRIKQQFIPNIEIVNTFNKAQTANLGLLKTKDKDYVLELEWMNACGIVVNDPSNCSFSGPKLSTNTEEVYLNLKKAAEFTVHDGDFIDNDFGREEAIAKGMLKADKELSEWVAQQMVAYLNLFAGVNALGTVSKGTVLGTTTYIEAPFWTAELVAYFNRVSILNKFTNPIFASGQNLFEGSEIAKYNSGNDNGKGKQAMYNGLGVDFDLFNIDTVNTPDFYSYLISMGSVAWASKSYYDANIVTYQTEKRWAEPSRFTPGLVIEWHYKNECDTDDDFFTHSYKPIIKLGIFNNPAGCDEDNTGVLKFLCGTAPA